MRFERTQAIELHERLFEVALAPEKGREANFQRMALALRQEAWERSSELVEMHALGQRLDSASVHTELGARAERLRLIGLAYLILWRGRGREDAIRALLEDPQ